MNTLLTGGTGFLGSHLAARFLADGEDVTLLVRGNGTAGPAERVRRLMEWHGVAPEALRRLRVVEADLTAPALGLDGGERERLRSWTDEVVHCASETSFAERKRALVEDVNLRGLGRLLDLALGSRRLRAFHHLSTAFVAGRVEGECREERAAAPGGFHNAYEDTKWRAERALEERCAAESVRLVVYRPSIVYGDSRTGRSLLFNALYHPVRAAAFLRDAYLKDIREKGGAQSRALGIGLEPDGRLRMPLRIEAEGAGLDLVPVDFFTAAFAALRASDPPDGSIFHVVSGRPVPVGDLAVFASSFLGLTGLVAAPPAEPASPARSALEAAFDRMIEVYRPYLSDRRSFARDRSGPILERSGAACPELTYDVFSRCMRYAADCGWASPVG